MSWTEGNCLVAALGCAVILVTVLSVCTRAPSVAFPGGQGMMMLPLAGVAGLLGAFWLIRRLRLHLIEA